MIAGLRALDRATGGEGGARRVAWTAGWSTARALLRADLEALGIAAEVDEAGNLWGVLGGRRAETVLVGSHLDSVPHGGWLDGALGVHAGLELLRALVEGGEVPERTVALVDWADEEGARFGRSLLGSSAVAGTLDVDAVAGLLDADGTRLADAMAEHGIDLVGAPAAAARLRDVCAYVELHIEQGPVLETEGLAVAAVSGTVGIERFMLRFAGRAGHAGTFPMVHRQDAGLAAAQTALEVERLALLHGGLGTTGQLQLAPGVVTAVPGSAALAVDLRHERGDSLEQLLDDTLASAHAAAAARRCDLTIEPIWRIAPRAFDPALVGAAQAVSAAVGGRERPLVSGALHDAAELALRVPATMIFSSSRGGVSHAPDEDTGERDLALAIEAFGRVTSELVTGALVPARNAEASAAC